MGFFIKKKKRSCDNRASIIQTWQYSYGNNAIKLLDDEAMRSGKIIIPETMEKFFDIDSITSEGEELVNLRFLNGNYSCNLKVHDSSIKGTLSINRDLLNTLYGINNAMIRDRIEGNLYIQFIKTGKFNFNIKAGVAKSK